MALESGVDRKAVESRLLGDGPSARELAKSLDLLWYACETAWPSELSPIVRDYTDHGPQHALRVLGWLDRVLALGRDCLLSEHEAYILLASVYLHDIGMQCDVAHRPEIREWLATAGVAPPEIWEAKNASDYPIEEQRWVRKHHAQLTAAWIESVRVRADAILGHAAQSIPDTLVGDIINIITHHSGLPLVDCPERMEFHPSGRLRFLAALVRFSDELDIDAARVSDPMVVQQFAMDPDNARYWWLHNFTLLDLSENHLQMTVTLNPFDYGRVHRRVYETMVAGFGEKNASALAILADNRVALVFSGEVRSNTRNKRLPQPILATFGDAVFASANPLASLVSTHMTALGFEVSPAEHPVGDSMLCSIDAGIVRQVVQLVCLDRPPHTDDIREATSHAPTSVASECWIVSRFDIPTEVTKAAKRHRQLKVMDASEFVRRIWEPYAAWLEGAVTNSGVSDDEYADPPCYQLIRRRAAKSSHVAYQRSSFRSLRAFVQDWYQTEPGNQLMLLGPFGSGKTTFARRHAWALLQGFFADPVRTRVPLLLSLRDLSKAVSVTDFVSSALVEKYRIKVNGSAWSFFDTLNRAGRLLLLLDGFDEMARRLDDEALSANFDALLELLDNSTRMVLTSRTECFNRVAGEERLAKAAKGTTLEAGRSTFEILYIDELRSEQVDHLIRARVAPRHPDVAERILGDQRLLEMASKPVLVDLLVAALAPDPKQDLSSYAAVYDSAVNALLDRNAERTITSRTQKLDFLATLGWAMLAAQKTRVHYSELAQVVAESGGETPYSSEDLTQVEFDMRTQTILHRDATGHYEFAHKSLADYFAAVHLASTLSSSAVCEEWTATMASDLTEALGWAAWESLHPFLLDMMDNATLRWLHAVAAQQCEGVDTGGFPVTLPFLTLFAIHDSKFTPIRDYLSYSHWPAELRHSLNKIDGHLEDALITPSEYYRQLMEILVRASDVTSIGEVDPATRARLLEITKAFIDWRHDRLLPEGTPC